MKILGIEIRRASKKEISRSNRLSTRGPHYTGSFLNSRSKPMLLSTVYRCVDILSSNVAQLDLETMKVDKQGYFNKAMEHPVYDLLSIEPNSNMSAYNFKRAMIVSALLTGNGYGYINRNSKGQAESIEFIHPSNCQSIWVLPPSGIEKRMYRVQGFKEYVEPKDMIHLLNFTYDGITGVSTLSHAANTISLSSANESQAQEFFEGGAATTGILTMEGVRMNKEQRDANYEALEARINPVTGRKRGILILSGNQQYQPISVTPKDSQLLESRMFNVIDICRFFGVSPVKCFDLSKSSYSTVEASQLDFLSGSLSPLIANFEQEINRKIFPRIEWHKYEAHFNLKNLIRADKVSKATYNREMFNIGAKTINEIRMEDGLDRIKGGDESFVAVNMQPLKKAVRRPKTEE